MKNLSAETKKKEKASQHNTSKSQQSHNKGSE
jgi:hypothetical protein